MVLNRTVQLDVALALGSIDETLTVSSAPDLLETSTSSTGGVVTPMQIETLPVNGRDSLDLMQLVPGVTVNREKDRGADDAVPVLGERAGNAIYLLDGMPNRDEFGGGAASQFNQDTIQEFEVITGGYKAEFGHGSGGVINVLTKGGGNQLKGLVFGYFRDDSLDSANSLEGGSDDAPELERQNYGFSLGGPVVKDRVFVFGSAERIDEDRVLNFTYPPATPQVLQDLEASFDQPNATEETRLFVKFDEQIGDRHNLSQQISDNDGEITDFLALSEANSLPSTRDNFDRERTMFGLRDTSLFGGSNPYLFQGYLQFRDESDLIAPSHPEAGPGTAFYIFSSTTTFGVFGDLGTVSFGNNVSESSFDSEYTAIGPSLARSWGNHQVEAGVDYLRTEVDGREFSYLNNQLFATEDNFRRYGPVYSGLFTLAKVGAGTPDGDLVHLRNDYLGIYLQDDWKIGDSLTLNLGVRWDRDSEFADDDNFAPRVGFAWSPTSKTVISGNYGLFYDRFRLGLVRDIPEFGGADVRLIQDLSYPQLFHNTTTIVPIRVGLCITPVAPHAAVAGTPCPFGLPVPHYGFDFLHGIVAPGRGPMPLGTPITRDNITNLSGLSPDQYLARVNAAVPVAGGALPWYWGPFGALTHGLLPLSPFPVTLDPSFETPYTEAFHLGVQHRIGRNQLIALDLHHKEMNNILGVRETNLKFISRVPGNTRTYEPPFTSVGITGFGPWFEGEYDAATLSYTRRLVKRFTISAHYTYTDAVDNMNGARLGNGAVAGAGSTNAAPNDSFVGIVPVVTDPVSGRTNTNGSFTASNGNFIPQAGTFHNGPDLDRGRSALALEHSFVLFGLVELPLRFQVSAIFRAQSGFPFSRAADQLSDPDGNLSFGTRDITLERNSFEGPSYSNLDLRVAKLFDIGSRIRATVLVEFFNVFNEQNAAAVENFDNRPTPFGEALQVLPGREGQVGFRLEF